MKVIILAGGYGTRLGSLTEAIPKPMLRIGNKPIIWHVMKIYSHYGYTDFVISLGYKADVVKEYFVNYTIYNNDFTISLQAQEITAHSRCNEDELRWKVSLIDTGLSSLKGARIKRLEKYLDDVNMVTYGDGVADIDIKSLLEFHKSHNKIMSITGVCPPSRFGEVIEKDGHILAFEEKPQTSAGLINGGFMVFDKKLLDYLTPDETCDLEIGAFDELAREDEIMVYKHEGQWECVDTERDLRHLNRLWEEDKAFWKKW